MYPVLLELGSIKIYSYGVMVALGFLLAVYLTSRQARRAGLSSAAIFDIYLYALIFGIVGARILHVILDIRHYIYYPLDIFRLNRGGLAFQGGLLSGILAAWFYIRKNKMPLWKTADVMSPYLALGHAVGRIGCMLNGCCYGKPTYSYFGFYLPGHVIQPLHPTQLYMSLYHLLTFIILKKIYEKKRFDGSVFFSYLALFSLGRFFIDFYRGDLKAVLFGLTVSQIISLAILFASVILLFKRRVECP